MVFCSGALSFLLRDKQVSLRAMICVIRLFVSCFLWMSNMKALWLIGCALALVGVSYAYQGPFREYPSVEHSVQPPPQDYQEKTEFAFARLMYPPGWNDGYRGRFDGDWRKGLSLWTQDYPPEERAFSPGAPGAT